MCSLLSHVFNKDTEKSFVPGKKQQGAKVVTVNNNTNSQEGGGVGEKTTSRFRGLQYISFKNNLCP